VRDRASSSLPTSNRDPVRAVEPFPDGLWLSEIASRGIRALLVNQFYAPLGLTVPIEGLTSRRKDAAEECAAKPVAADEPQYVPIKL
jgi:hypothetical protein